MEEYGFWRFIGDVILTIITGGLWFMYLVLRHIRH